MAESSSSLRFATLFLAVIFCANIDFAQGQLGKVTDPPPGRHPVEANGRLYNIPYVPGVCKDPYIVAKESFEGGTTIKNRQVLMQKYGPFHIKGNIEIAPIGCLVIMPGTELYFDPGYGMIVNGTLIARVSLSQVIKILFVLRPVVRMQV